MRRPLVTGRARAAAVAVLVALAGLGVGATLVLLAGGLLVASGVELGLVEGIVLAAVLSQVGFAAVAVGFLVRSGRGLGSLGVGLPTGRDLRWIVGGYVLVLVAAASGAVLATATSAPTARNQVADLGVREPETLLWLVPIAILVIGPAEELLFRGTVQARLREAFDPWVAVVAASALFAALHVVALTGGLEGRLVTVGLLFLPSLVLGAAYERTGNLVVPAVVHGTYDATLFVILYLAVRYAPGAV